MVVVSLQSCFNLQYVEGKALLICAVSLPHISFIIDNLTWDWLNGRRDSTQGRKETKTWVLTEQV